jgi:NitT/TauT family transport system substrate-binding protein
VPAPFVAAVAWARSVLRGVYRYIMSRSKQRPFEMYPDAAIGRRLLLQRAGASLAGVGVGTFGFGTAPSNAAGAITPMSFMQGSFSLGWGPVQLATLAGYFKQQGVDPTVTYQGAGGTTTNVGAVLGGSADLGGQVGTSLTAVRAGGADIRIIGVLTNRIEVKVVVRTEVAKSLGVKATDPLSKRLKSLYGLKIATIDLGGGPYFALQYALRRQNTDLSKVASVTGISSWDAIIAALQSGRIDAGVFTEPYGEMAAQDGKGVLVMSTSGGEFPELGNQIFTCIYANNNYARNPARRELLGRFMTAIAQAQQVIATQPQVAKARLGPLYPALPSDIFSTAFRDTGFTPTPFIRSTAFDNTQKYQAAASNTTLNVNFGDLIDNTFATAAVASLKGIRTK